MRPIALSGAVLCAAALYAPGALAQQTPPSPVALRRVSVVPSQGTSAVRAILSRALSAFQTCAEAAWRVAPVAGTLNVTFQTGPNGEVATARAGRSGLTPPAPPLNQCIVGVVRRLMFPGSVQGVLDVTFTLQLTPPAGGTPPATPPAPPPAPH
jgi:hypothetical protein